MIASIFGSKDERDRTYAFLSSVLPYAKPDWEKLSIFLNFLLPKLPAPQEEDLSRGILEAIDMDSYRVEKKAALRITPPDADAEIGPVPVEGGGGRDPLRLHAAGYGDTDPVGGNATDADRQQNRRVELAYSR